MRVCCLVTGRQTRLLGCKTVGLSLWWYDGSRLDERKALLLLLVLSLSVCFLTKSSVGVLFDKVSQRLVNVL